MSRIFRISLFEKNCLTLLRLAGMGAWVLLFFVLGACNIGGGNSDKQAPAEINYYFSPEGIRELKARFSLDEKTGWYTHQLWKEQPVAHTTLLASVNQNGYYVLSSNYFGDKALQHTQVIVWIGEQRFATKTLDLQTADHDVRYVEDKIVETNRYAEYGDNALFENIADSGDREIRIRFQARTEHVDVLLSDADRQALIDCFQLSILNRMSQQ